MKKLIAVTALSLFSCFAHASGSFLSANALVMRLQIPDMQVMSVGYIMGIADAQDGKAFCIPAGTDHVSLVRTVYLVGQRLGLAQADIMSEPAHIFVKDIFSKAYPCTRKKQ